VPRPRADGGETKDRIVRLYLFGRPWRKAHRSCLHHNRAVAALRSSSNGIEPSNNKSCASSGPVELNKTICFHLPESNGSSMATYLAFQRAVVCPHCGLVQTKLTRYDLGRITQRGLKAQGACA